MNIEIREEQTTDISGIGDVVRDAFEGRKEEPRLVELIRDRKESLLSLVALESNRIVGHVMVSPIEVTSSASLTYGGIAPLSVASDRQRTGIGGALMEAVIARSPGIGLDALFLLGSPSYYPRFGFTASHIGNEYGATEAFMHLEVTVGCLRGQKGLAKYVSAFREVGA